MKEVVDPNSKTYRINANISVVVEEKLPSTSSKPKLSPEDQELIRRATEQRDKGPHADQETGNSQPMTKEEAEKELYGRWSDLPSDFRG